MAETSKATPAKKTATKAGKATTAPKAGVVDAKANVKKTEPAKAVVAKKTPAKKRVSDEQRYRMIAEAAYYRAESRHFKSDPLRDWIEAEQDIANLLGENR